MEYSQNTNYKVKGVFFDAIALLILISAESDGHHLSLMCFLEFLRSH